MKILNVTAEIVGTGANLYHVSLCPDWWESAALYLAAGDTENDAVEAAIADLTANASETIARDDMTVSAYLVGTFCHG